MTTGAAIRTRVDLFSLLIGIAFAMVGVLYLLDLSGRLDVDPGLMWPLLLIAGGAGATANSFIGRDTDAEAPVPPQP